MVATTLNTIQPIVDKNHHITTSNVCINAYKGHDTGQENIRITGVSGIRHQDVHDMACQGKQGERGALKMHTHPNKTYHSDGL